jgi:nitrogen fixation NifU-like protein
MMTQSVKGKTIQEAQQLFEHFRQTVMGHVPANGSENVKRADLGKLAVFAGVAEFPTRVKCAILAWHTLQAALESKQQAISTE